VNQAIQYGHFEDSRVLPVECHVTYKSIAKNPLHLTLVR
jgi:hypothetical protein